MEQNKNEEQVVEPKVVSEGTLNENNDIDNKTLFENIKGLFSGQSRGEKKEEEVKVEVEQKQEEKESTFALPKTEEELNAMIQQAVIGALDTRDSQVQIQAKLNENVKDEFKDFIDFKIKNEKDFDLDKFLADNPAYSKKAVQAQANANPKASAVMNASQSGLTEKEKLFTF